MTAAKRIVIAGAAVLAITAGSERRPISATAASYTLSGSPDGTGIFYVDDNLDVFLNGNVVFTENRPEGSIKDHNPIPITVEIGDTIEFRVRDTYGVCAKLTTVYLTNEDASRSIVADPGFDEGCGRPTGDLGVVHTYAFTIPDLSVLPRAEFVAQIQPGAGPNSGGGPSNFAVFQNALYFAADDGVNGRELWRLTADGQTAMVANLHPEGSSTPEQLVATADRLYFTATTPATGKEVWQYDGLNLPTLVEDIQPGGVGSDPNELTALGDQIVFVADLRNFDTELAAYSPATGYRPFNIFLEDPNCDPCGSYPYDLTVHNGILYFGAGIPIGTNGLFYQYDGTSIQLLPNTASNTPVGPEHFTGIGSRLVFSAFVNRFFQSNQLYSFALPSGPTVELTSGNHPNGAHPQFFASINGRAYFSALDSLSGRELWSTDGTQDGTRLIANINPDTGNSDPKYFTPLNGEVYFVATDPTAGAELHATNGTSVRLVKDLRLGSLGSGINPPVVLGPYLIFDANAANGQIYPWFTTGTDLTFDQVRKSDGNLINPSGNATEDAEFTLFNGALYFAANDGTRGYELWRITLGSVAPSTPTTTTLGASPNPSQFGETVTLTATVTAASGTPGGSVTFLDGAASLGSATLLNGVATLTTNGLSVGSHTLTASYGGAGGFAGSTSAGVTQTVNPVVTSTSLSSSQNPSAWLDSVTLTATVTGGTPSGDVSFFDGVTLLATVTLSGNTASYTTSGLSIGTHSITAGYLGNATHAASTSNTLSQEMTRRPTTLTLTSSPNPSTFGELVVFTAVQSGFDNESGTVEFREGGVVLATGVQFTGNTNPGFTISTLTVGSHTITVTWNGNATHAPSSSSVVHVVNPANIQPTAPVADPKIVTTDEDTAAGITLTASDANGDQISFVDVSLPAHGTLSGTPPNLTYSPAANYSGFDSFTYKASDGTLLSTPATVSINVVRVNDAPVAANDGYTTAEDTPLTVTVPGVMANDSDVDSSPITVSVVTSTVHGVLVLNPDGSFGYTPMANFFGADGFTYRVSDGQLTSDIVPVSIAVTPVNDAPAAVDDSYTTTEGQALTIAAPGVLANDTDVEASPLTATQASGPSNGVLTLNGNGSFTYTPGANFTGSDTFTYRASDGVTPSNVATVTISVVPRTFTWTATGVLGTRRRAHTATLLPNGKVLVTGGYGQGNSAMNNAELYDPLTGIWGPVNSMRVRRAFHTATLLPNGHVLVAGGENNGFVTRTETYDPATGIWTEAGLLNAVHSRHTATLLLSGRVLVVGGYDNSGSLGGAELFDPATRTWTQTGSLGVGRHFQTATLLPDGRVLAVGGFGTNGAVNSAELYNPGSGTWSTTASLSTNRTGHTATLLGNGKVLIVGGGNNSSPTLATTELFDPINDTWTIGPSSVTARISHTATVLPSGRVLVAGGNTAAGGLHIASEIFDPTTGQWSLTASLISARAFHTATLLADGRVLAAGGLGALNSAELYGPAAGPSVGRWETAASLPAARRYHTATLLADGRVLVVGGMTGGLVSGSAEIFDPGTRVWTPTGSLNLPRAFHVAVLLADGRVLVAAGSALAVGPRLAAEIYDPATGTWSVTGSIGVGRDSATVTLLPGNRGVLLAGGIGPSGPTNTAEIYNPATGSWSSAGSFSEPRYAHRATSLPDGRVLLTGGCTIGGNSFLNSAVIYDPATFTWTAVAGMASRRCSHSATLLPNGTVLVAGGVTKQGVIAAAEVFDPASGTWTPTVAMNSVRGGHSATLLPNGAVLVAGGKSQLQGGEWLTSEIYAPNADTWTASGSLASPRAFHTATLLANGKVLVVGGETTNGVAVATAELFTP